MGKAKEIFKNADLFVFLWAPSELCRTEAAPPKLARLAAHSQVDDFGPLLRVAGPGFVYPSGATSCMGCGFHWDGRRG